MRISFFTNYFLTVSILLITACHSADKKPEPVTNSTLSASLYADLPHALIKKLTDIIVVDIFSPPVSSRIYANCALAMYEAIRLSDTSSSSIAAKLNGFDQMPVPDKGLRYDFAISAVNAFCETAKKVTFSGEEISRFQDSLIGILSMDVSKEVVDRSLEFGLQVANVISRRLVNDYYKETRGMERYEVNTGDPARWVPTAPDYADALEPHWFRMKAFVLDAPDQFKADVYPMYDPHPKSAFYREMQEVFNLSKQLTDEQMDITLFWDDNPFISKHKGHVMFQDKKMTPGGHWMAIAQHASKRTGLDAVASAKVYVVTSIALYEAFIACWNEKYRSNRIRPQTAIQRLIDDQWFSYLQTPPFPEYTSGHSTVSAAAATALTFSFGEGFAFTDSSEREYGLPVRSFSSFQQAALEASISRLYGGIHFRSGCENGNKLGLQVGEAVINRIFR